MVDHVLLDNLLIQSRILARVCDFGASVTIALKILLTNFAEALNSNGNSFGPYTKEKCTRALRNSLAQKLKSLLVDMPLSMPIIDLKGLSGKALFAKLA